MRQSRTSATLASSTRWVTLALLLAMQARASTEPPDPIDYRQTLHWTASVPLAGEPGEVKISGKYAYVADGERGLAVLDLADPLHPEQVADLPLGGDSHLLALYGQTAYVEIRFTQSTFAVVDITDPTAPTYIRTFHAGGGAEDIEVNAGHLYCPGLSGGVRVFSLADPTNPLLVATIDAGGDGAEITFFGSYGYLAAGEGGLQVFDFSAPSAPRFLGRIGEWSWVRGVERHGEFLYAYDYPAVHVFNLIDPAHPQRIQSIEPFEAGAGMVGLNDRLFVPAEQTVSVLDLSAPSAAEVVALFRTPGSAAGVAVSETMVLQSDGIREEVRAYANPMAGTACPIGVAPTLTDAKAVSVQQGLAAVATGASGSIALLDLADPRTPILLASLPIAAYVSDVVLHDRLALAACANDGLVVVDVSDPQQPRVLAQVPTAGSAKAVAFQGTIVAIAESNRGVRLVDLTNPSQPLILIDVDTPGTALDVALGADRCLVADGAAGLAVIDTSIPDRAHVIARFETRGAARALALIDPFVLLADPIAGLSILRVADVPSPILVGSLPTAGDVAAIAVNDGVAWMAEGVVGLELLDLGDPARPLRVATAATRGIAQGLDFVAGHPVVADDAQGVTILPAQRTVASTIRNTARIRRVAGSTPLPFKEQVALHWEQRGTESAAIRIVDSTGRSIRLLAGTAGPAGPRVLEWDGRDERGRAVPPGVYWSEITCEEERMAIRVLRIR